MIKAKKREEGSRTKKKRIRGEFKRGEKEGKDLSLKATLLLEI